MPQIIYIYTVYIAFDRRDVIVIYFSSNVRIFLRLSLFFRTYACASLIGIGLLIILQFSRFFDGVSDFRLLCYSFCFSASKIIILTLQLF